MAGDGGAARGVGARVRSTGDMSEPNPTPTHRSAPPPEPVRPRLRAALTTAMKARDRESVAVLRATLAALDNAEAAPLGERPRAGAIEASAIGVGAAEVARVPLTEPEQRALVAAEIAERQAAAQQVQATHPDRADLLRREARTLADLLT